MPIGPSVWIAVPLLGGLIGYLTNRLAVRMIFRPIEPRRVLGFKVQGLIGRRQNELAESIGRVVGGHLLQHDDIVLALKKMDLETLGKSAIDRGLGGKVEELRVKMPLIAGFLTEERVASLGEQIGAALFSDKEALAEELERAVEAGLDVREIVTEKVAAFPVERLESLVLEVAARELRSIEVLGGVLGVLIGFAQVGVLGLLS